MWTDEIQLRTKCRRRRPPHSEMYRPFVPRALGHFGKCTTGVGGPLPIGRCRCAAESAARRVRMYVEFMRSYGNRLPLKPVGS